MRHSTVPARNNSVHGAITKLATSGRNTREMMDLSLVRNPVVTATAVDDGIGDVIEGRRRRRDIDRGIIYGKGRDQQ